MLVVLRLRPATAIWLWSLFRANALACPSIHIVDMVEGSASSWESDILAKLFYIENEIYVLHSLLKYIATWQKKPR